MSARLVSTSQKKSFFSFVYTPLFQAICFSLFIANACSFHVTNSFTSWLFSTIVTSFMGGLCWYHLHTVLNSIYSEINKNKAGN